MLEDWILITGGTVIDATGGAARHGVDVVLHGNIIVAVGEDTTGVEMPPKEKMRRIDATGKTVMPGLIDVHCHMTYGEARYEEEIDLYTSPEMRTLIAAANARKVLRSGVTSISQPGGSYYIGVGIREGIKAGLVQGPRMTSAGRYLTTSNGLTDWYPDSVGVPDGSIGKLTNTIDEMRVEIRHQVKNGVDLIKLADSPYGDFQAFTNDELKAVADIAHQLNKKVTIHARGPAEVGAAADAGLDWIMHGNIMTDESIEKLVESGTTLVPTLLLLANLADWPELTGAPFGQWDGCRRMLEKTVSSLHRAHEAGVPFAMGTDSGFAITPYGEWHARELELLTVYSGMSNMEAIVAGTANGAKMMNLEGKLGKLLPGWLADVIIVNGNPLENLHVLVDKRNVETVIKDGVVQEFPDDLDLVRYHNDRDPLIYSQTELTYDMVTGENPDKPYNVLPWSMRDAREVVHEFDRAQKAVVVPEDGMRHD
jgi:imidazolonepropionase-like amidohydrolase